MAIQKFALYDLIVDIIPRAILLVVFYSVAPTGLYKHFFGISPSLVPGIAVILFSYPVGRIIVHGCSSKLENPLLSLYTRPVNFLRKGWNIYYGLIFEKERSKDESEGLKVEKRESTAEKGNTLSIRQEEDVSRQQEDVSRQQEDVSRQQEDVSRQQEDVNRQNEEIENWFVNPETTPSDISSSVVHEVQAGLEIIAGVDTHPKALRRYGENILFSRDTLYGKYEILSTFYRHMAFTSILASVIYIFYFLLHDAKLPSQLYVRGSAPISNWPSAMLVALPIIALSISFLCLWRWKDWTESRNRAFINDLHTYLREQDLIGRDGTVEQLPLSYF